MEQEVHRAGDEEVDDHVASEHVAEESQGQRERPDDEVRRELEDEDHRGDPAGHPRGHHVLEVADEAHLLEADPVVDDVHHEGQGDREADLARDGVHREEEDAHEVEEEDHREERHEERDEALELLGPDHVSRDRVAREVVEALEEPLGLARDDGRALAQRDEGDGEDGGDDPGPGHLVGDDDRADLEERLPEDLRGGRLVALPTSGSGQRGGMRSQGH